MSRFIKTAISIALMSVVSVIPKASASELVQTLGQARLEYASSDQGVYRKVFHLAKINALQRFVMSTYPEAKIQLYNRYEPELTSYENIDRYIIDASEMEPAEDTALTQRKGQNDKSIRLAVRATVSASALDAFFQSRSAAGTAGVGESSEFGVLFFGRRIDSRTEFDTKRVRVSESDLLESDENTFGVDETSSLAGINRTSTNREATGGSRNNRRAADVYVADISLTNNLSAAIREELVDAGFEPIEVEDIVDAYELYYLDELVDEGMIRDDGTLPRRTLNDYKKAAFEEGWRFFGFGRVDIGLPQLDERGTGIMKVAATVSFEVFMDVEGRARSVAVVAPETLWGDDPNGDPVVAEQRAYRMAVETAMQTVVSQLQASNLY